MNIQAEKLSLVQSILNIEDVSLIKDIKSLLKNRDNDWFDELSDDQQQAVMKSLEKLDKGEGIPHEEAIARLGL